MTNGLECGRAANPLVDYRGMMVPLKFTLGTSAAVVKAVPLLLVDLLNEDGRNGQGICVLLPAVGAVATSSHLFEGRRSL